MNKNISKTKLFLVFISLIITFFVWQQGLRDSLSRPSVSSDISQKEKVIAELDLVNIHVLDRSSPTKKGILISVSEQYRTCIFNS